MQLGAFMRLNVKVMASRRTTIREEMELLNAYLDIIQIRFEDQFTFECQLDPVLGELMIPPATRKCWWRTALSTACAIRRAGHHPADPKACGRSGGCTTAGQRGRYLA